MNRIMRTTSLALSTGAIVLAVAAASTGAMAHGKKKPIMLDRSGGFIIGGEHRVINPAVPNRTLSCDHGYVEYFIPAEPRKTSIVLWHSSSAQVWQNRWDGGEGYKDKMLRADYPTYIWDGPQVGRANWSCQSITFTPTARDQGNFTAWKFGPTIPVGQVPTPAEFYPNSKFPINHPNFVDYWWNATGARYDEFDNAANVQLQTREAAVAADSGRLGKQIVYLTNSAGGLRAQMTTAKSTKRNIAGIVTYESVGYIFPEGDPESPAPCADQNSPTTCGFGPFHVPLEDFKKLAKLKKIQFVWGDNQPETAVQVINSRICAKLINKYGGNAEVLKLGDIPGFEGSSHIPFADMHNDKVADLLFKLLKKNKLDGYADNHDDDDDDDHHHH
jgi:hypothetical protein